MAPTPHALVFPYPAQSHVISLLELSYSLLDRGFKITFLNTEFNHGRLVDTQHAVGIQFASIPDGLSPADDRNDLGRLTEAMMSSMPGYLEDFIEKQARESAEERFTFLLADQSMSWALYVAKKMGLRSAAFCPMSAGVLVGNLSIPNLIEDGIIDQEGVPKQQKMFQLSPEMPPMDSTQLCWNCFNDSKTRKILFNLIANSTRGVTNAELIICNTFYELEKLFFSYAPNILPIGPLLSGSRADKLTGNFLLQDTKCIEWLNEHPINSVIYVAFGSFAIFNQNQIQELALGLELTGQPFLWVIRTDMTCNLDLSSFIERVESRGKIVGWSPQQQVLTHPSTACFITHCGWNSTLEGVRNGVPLLCWPYFADQFFNQSYICDIWRVGLRMVAEENGVYSKEEIRSKVEELLGDSEIKERSLALKEMACMTLEKGGSSFENFNNFVDLMKGGS